MHILSVLNNVTVHFPYFAVDFFLLIACRFFYNPQNEALLNLETKRMQK